MLISEPLCCQCREAAPAVATGSAGVESLALALWVGNGCECWCWAISGMGLVCSLRTLLGMASRTRFSGLGWRISRSLLREGIVAILRQAESSLPPTQYPDRRPPRTGRPVQVSCRGWTSQCRFPRPCVSRELPVGAGAALRSGAQCAVPSVGPVSCDSVIASFVPGCKML